MQCDRLGVWRPQGQHWRLIAVPWSDREARLIAAQFADAVAAVGPPQIPTGSAKPGLPIRDPNWWQVAWVPPWHRKAARARRAARRAAFKANAL